MPAPNGVMGVVGVDANGNAFPLDGGGSVASGSLDSGNPVKAGGVYHSTPPTFTDGQRGDLQIGSMGALNVTLWQQNGTAALASASYGADATAPGTANLITKSFTGVFNGAAWDRPRSAQGVDGTGLGVTAVEEGGRAFSNINGAATTTVKSGAGSLHGITINTLAASATITIYNNTAGSGAKIATITLPSTITAVGPVTLPYDIYFGTGLTIVTSGATDITVSYR